MNSERTAFLAIVTVALLAALVAAPAAARDVTAGSTIFVGEENLNLTAINGTPVATLVHYSEITSVTTGIIERVISVGSSNAFELNAADNGTTIGAWYALTANADLTNPRAANGYILVQVPSTRLDVKLAGTTETVNAKTVTRASSIVFDIEHNLGSLTPAATMNIEVTTPGGGKLNVFGNNSVDLRGVALTGQKYTSPAIQLAGVEAGTYTAQAKWPSGSDFYGKGYDSNTVTFEVITKTLGITANKDSVVRGNNFVVTITGESSTTYYLYVRDAALGAIEYPSIPVGQPGVSLTTVLGGSAPQANVTTNAAGSRSVQFNTNQSTDDRSFTIRVESQTDATTYDEVKVRVEEGAITVTATGTGVYYIGEEITLSGTNTDSNSVYLFLTGPNLGTNGVKLSDLNTNVVNGTANTFTEKAVETDDTWTYRWDTANLNRVLDSGGYTIYAVSQPRSKDALSGVQYATTSVQLRSAFITATSSGATVAKGDKLTITGTAQGNPDNVYVWIFGKNYYNTLGRSATVESDSTFEYNLESGDTRDLSSGQYFVVVQHPMNNGAGVTVNASGYIQAQGITPVNLRALPASEAANALINALDSPYVDDTYTKLTFVIEEPQIFIDAIGDKTAGSTFTISGTTNLAVGDKLNVEVTSAAFQPTSKTEVSGFGAASGVATVQKGDGVNTWSMDVDATGFKPDQYIVRVESVETETTQTATFNVIEGTATTQPTGNVTATPTGTETTAPTTAATTAAPTQSPGFGALVALAGLGAVAFLVLRRN
jgi:PGF-CTERM protein